MTDRHGDGSQTESGRDPSGGRSDEEAVATAVLGLESVVALSSGPLGQFRSYLPGGSSVPGVRVDDERLDVNVVTLYGSSLPELGATVADALGPLARGRTVTVNVADVVLPGEDLPDAAESIVEAACATGARVPDLDL